MSTASLPDSREDRHRVIKMRLASSGQHTGPSGDSTKTVVTASSRFAGIPHDRYLIALKLSPFHYGSSEPGSGGVSSQDIEYGTVLCRSTTPGDTIPQATGPAWDKAMVNGLQSFNTYMATHARLLPETPLSKADIESLANAFVRSDLIGELTRQGKWDLAKGSRCIQMVTEEELTNAVGKPESICRVGVPTVSGPGRGIVRLFSHSATQRPLIMINPQYWSCPGDPNGSVMWRAVTMFARPSEPVADEIWLLMSGYGEISERYDTEVEIGEQSSNIYVNNMANDRGVTGLPDKEVDALNFAKRFFQIMRKL